MRNWRRPSRGSDSSDSRSKLESSNRSRSMIPLLGRVPDARVTRVVPDLRYSSNPQAAVCTDYSGTLADLGHGTKRFSYSRVGSTGQEARSGREARLFQG